MRKRQERVTKREDDDDDDVHVGQRRQLRQDHRRDRHDRVDVRVVRNVRGSRGGLSGHRMERHAPMKERYDRYRDHDGEGRGYRKDQRHEERNYENHRRGVMRGSVRGGKFCLDSPCFSLRKISYAGLKGRISAGMKEIL
ncbi:hypothetical protein ANCCAN_00798 [Ancylostoma caninum]|uniref:Uncharacterized protein n=1 Tax=Ancylostoma caninum TaxID=29170 RepID=A0A368HC72_ANCCA|nr:hypothetical protein ANCCAN_00798 [Ancylostoma caninum]